MNAKQALKEFQLLVDVEIEGFFQNEREKAREVSPVAEIALERLSAYCLRPGKRIRPALMYYGYRLFEGENEKEIIKASIAPEILHAYLLIHDDIMDEDAMRRGEATMHEIYTDEHRRLYKKYDPAHFGEAMAICLGDVGCHYAMQALAAADFPSDKKTAAILKLHQQIITVGYGQMLDVMSTVMEDEDVTEEYVMRVHKYKTGVYTYETPLMIGATLAGASEEDIKVLSNYAIPAGIAFQIQDDILGMFGDQEKTGKANDSDLKEGKHTLLILKALEEANDAQAVTIRSALGNPQLTSELADDVREIIKKTGSLQYSIDTALSYVRQAKKALEARPAWTNEGRQFLDAVADYMINREF